MPYNPRFRGAEAASAEDKRLSKSVARRGRLHVANRRPVRLCLRARPRLDGRRVHQGPATSGACAGPATMLSCWRSPRSGTCSADAARQGFWPRWPGTGATCFRTKARPTAGPAGCWAPSSSCGSPSRHGCRKTTASKWTPRAAGQAPLPGPRQRRLDRARQRPGHPVWPRRRPCRVVLRLPARRENRPGQPDRPLLGHRARRGERAPGRRRPARSRARPARPARGQGIQRQGLRGQPGHPRHRRPGSPR